MGTVKKPERIIFMVYTYEYQRPAVTVDMVVLAPAGDGHEVLLIKRGDDPFKGQWALPGGFMEIDEELEDAAARELEEETGLKGIALKEIGAFGKVGRDPRGRTVSIVYMAVLPSRSDARAGDDAAEAAWFPLHAAPSLAFDHNDIIARAQDMLG